MSHMLCWHLWKLIHVCALCCAFQCWNTKLRQAEQASEDKTLTEAEKEHGERERQRDLRYWDKEENEEGLERQRL